MAIPNFVVRNDLDENILPEGIHQATPDEIHSAFVEGFPGSSTRGEIFDGFMRYRTLLHAHFPIVNEYVEGSFVTSRVDPKDVDLSFWIRAEDIAAANKFSSQILQHLVGGASRADVKKAYLCDAYCVPVCDPSHQSYGVFQKMLWTKTHWESYSDRNKVIRSGVRKGYVEVVE